MSNFTDELHGKMHRLLDNDEHNVAVDLPRAQQNLGTIIDFVNSDGPVAINNGVQEAVMITPEDFQQMVTVVQRINSLEELSPAAAEFIKSLLYPQKNIDMDPTVFGVDPKEAEGFVITLSETQATRIADLRAAAENDAEAAEVFADLSKTVQDSYQMLKQRRDTEEN